jgi:hypothetical protein
MAATSPLEYWRGRLALERQESTTEGMQPYEFPEILGQAGDIRGA